MYKFLYSLLLISMTWACFSCGSSSYKPRSSNVTETGTDSEDTFLEGFQTVTSFTQNSNYKGILSDGSSLFLATTNNKLVPCEQFTYNYFPYGEIEDPGDANDENCIKKACYVAIVDGNVKVFDENGNSMLNNGISEYCLYPYGSFLYGKSSNGWNLYTLDKIQSDSNNKSPYFNIYFKDCVITADGAILKGFDDDVFLSRTDEGYMTLTNLSEEERNQAMYQDINEQERINNNLMLLSMIFNSSISSSQAYDVGDYYSGFGASMRSKADIERDIAKYKREIAFCESHQNDGIAEGMGYSGIISNYSNMIEQCERELQFAN